MELKPHHEPSPHRRAIASTLLLAALPRTAWPQPAGRKWRIAYLNGSSLDAAMVSMFLDPLRQGLRELGYVEGRNYDVEFRFAEGKPERLPGLLVELTRWQPDVLLAVGPRPAVLAKEANLPFPVVAVAVDDPVQMGLAAGIARPGGNITGVSLGHVDQPCGGLGDTAHKVVIQD